MPACRKSSRTFFPQDITKHSARRSYHCRTNEHEKWKGGDRLAVSLSVVVVLGVEVILLCRYAGLRMSHAVICVVLGFYLASSSVAPEIARITESLFRML
jgi:hypothetical protein